MLFYIRWQEQLAFCFWRISLGQLLITYPWCILLDIHKLWLWIIEIFLVVGALHCTWLPLDTYITSMLPNPFKNIFNLTLKILNKISLKKVASGRLPHFIIWILFMVQMNKIISRYKKSGHAQATKFKIL